jgi:hypothetical protein
VHVPGDYVFWVAGESMRWVPVVLPGERTGRQSESKKEVRVGDTVAIFGTVREVRGVRLLEESWAMTRADWEQLGREKVYISALRVEQLDR